MYGDCPFQREVCTCCSEDGGVPPRCLPNSLVTITHQQRIYTVLEILWFLCFVLDRVDHNEVFYV